MPYIESPTRPRRFMGRDRRELWTRTGGQHHRPDGTQLRQQVRSVTSPQTVAQMGQRPGVHRGTPPARHVLGHHAGSPARPAHCWPASRSPGPAPEREVIGRLLPDAANRLPRLPAVIPRRLGQVLLAVEHRRRRLRPSSLAAGAAPNPDHPTDGKRRRQRWARRSGPANTGAR